MTGPTDDELLNAYERAAAALLAEASSDGHWVGELSASALSTATAVAALSLLIQRAPHRTPELQPLVDQGLSWLATHQNADGGWGDTILSVSNISTTMLARAAFVLGQQADRYPQVVTDAVAWIDRAGGGPAVHARYGTDRTFSAPILTQCAIAGLVDWRDVAALPFELAWLPHSFYKFVSLPVVSYALPALIAIGQVRHKSRPTWFWPLRWLRQAAVAPTLAKLERIQPQGGGFLEATPLTSFVTMSLIAAGRSDHPVVERGIDFLVRSVRADGSWPIDTNLATWVTTLALNGLDDETLPESQQRSIAEWLLGQQLKTIHPYTQAAPGGWAWTDLPGGVPDADDTPGAILALLKLSRLPGLQPRCSQAVSAGVNWLLDLQNRDGGWPTFCRGWGTLPFDRSSCDITAHALRALHAWHEAEVEPPTLRSAQQVDRIQHAIASGFAFLAKQQRADGSWLPLWFGNQHVPDDENATYGTARVLLAYRDLGRLTDPRAIRGLDWLVRQQNDDGGWGGLRGVPSSVEESSLALEALAGCPDHSAAHARGLCWLVRQVDEGSWATPSPIGFYFAKLWYFERLYPLVYSVAALRRALESRALRQTTLCERL